ncbi:M56 family metallopeptidase [Singulisphaera sp. Ch08]|uniref:M56 family metallopeptidase n=1 Tax=Singulisphaera sp. Ch08 TaxID=3120278 RepID=A0AAU7CJ53_9BACT
MTITALTDSRPWLLAGWTMLHFFWVGGLIGLAVALLRRTLRRARPEVRYGVAILGLAVMAIAPVMIASILVLASRPINRQPVSRPFTQAPMSELADVPPSMALSQPPEFPNAAPPDWPHPVTTTGPIAPKQQILVVAARGLPGLWLVGAPATFALLATGLIGTERLRRRSHSLTEGEIPELCRRLATALGLVRPVALGVCDRLMTPVLLGVVRPLILLPTSALTGWSPEQVEMALLHELAHVRRLDNLVNLIQRTIEAVLFFHPAVWWVSGWVRLEREHCCDKLVIAHTGRARPYAELLAALAMPGRSPSRAAVAMAEAPIVDRIRRILNLEDQSMRLSRSFVALVAGLLIAPAVVITSQAGPPDQAKEQPSAPLGTSPKRDARLEPILQRAVHDAESLTSPREQARALTRIAGVQARTGDRDGSRQTFAKAVALAETVALSAPRTAPLFLFKVFNAYLPDYSFDKANDLLAILERFPAVIDTDVSQYSPHILLWVAQAQAKAGFRDEAIGSLRKLLRIAQLPAENDYGKIELFEETMKAQVKLDNKEGIRETLRTANQFYTTTNDKFIKLYAPQAIVTLQAESGDLAGAFNLINQFAIFKEPHNETRRREALFAIVAKVKSGDEKVAIPILREAVQSIGPVKSPFPKQGSTAQSMELKTIAEAEARLGHFAEAIKHAHQINTLQETSSKETLPKRLPYDIKTLQETLPKGTLPDDALSKKLGIRNHEKSIKARTFAFIGEAQAKARDRAGAKQSAEEVASIALTMVDNLQKDGALERASTILAKEGDLEGAFRLADMMTPDRNPNQYMGISRIQRESGDNAGAQRTLDAAMRKLQPRFDALDPNQPERPSTLESEHDRLLRQMSWIQSAQGNLKGALKSAQQINVSTVRVRVMTDLARHQAMANDLEGAMEVIGKFESPKLEAEALEAVLDAFPQRETLKN